MRSGRDHAKERFWRQTLKRWQASQLSVREFCRQEKLSEPSLYAWRRTIAQRDRQQDRSSAARTSRASRAAPRFLPVAVVGASLLEVESLLNGSHGTVEVVDGVAKVKIPFVTKVDDTFFREIQKYAKDNGATSMVVEFQASNTDLAIALGTRMKEGRTLMGGKITIVSPLGVSPPTFRIEFDKVPE